MLAVSVLALTAALAPPTVIVTGATGRVGRLVIDRLLSRPGVVTTVRALVRDVEKAKELLPVSDSIELIECDLASDDASNAIGTACDGADALIWCASGFKADGTLIDIDCVTDFGRAMSSGGGSLPKIALCSSAGVTRPEWPEAKKTTLIGASDIPIIRLNPGGILGQKVTAEEALRSTGVPYCIVRPTGLKDDWPAGRPILSQGDVAVGRTSPADLARVLVSALTSPGSEGKTFEMFTLTGYPAPSDGLSTALAGLTPDAAGPLPETRVTAAYELLQQLLPGEAQDATRLEMGRTYEQVDAGEVSRERGAAPTAREQAIASAALESITTPAPRKRDAVKRF